MTWFAFHGYNPIDLAGAQEKEAVALGFHGYGTLPQAMAHPNSVSWFQKPLLNLLEKDYAFAKAHGQQPGGPNASFPNIITSDVGSIAENVVPGVKDIGNFFHILTEKSTWVRVGEVLAGSIVLYVGLKSLTSNTPVGEAAKQTTSGAKRAANVIPQARAARAVRQAKSARRIREASRYRDAKGNIKVTRG